MLHTETWDGREQTEIFKIKGGEGTVASHLNALRVYNLDCHNELQTA